MKLAVGKVAGILTWARTGGAERTGDSTSRKIRRKSFEIVKLRVGDFMRIKVFV